MELGIGGKTSEEQATMAFAGNSLMCGDTRRGLRVRLCGHN